jgi:hypothetical protein
MDIVTTVLGRVALLCRLQLPAGVCWIGLTLVLYPVGVLAP